MPASAVKVVPPFKARGLFLCSAIFGAVFGIAARSQESWTFRLAQSLVHRGIVSQYQGDMLGNALTIVVFLVPAVVVGVWLSCLSQRRAQTALAAALAGAAELLATLLANLILWSSHGGTEWWGWRWWDAFQFLIPVAIVGAVSAGVALLIRWLVRAVLFTVIEQDGSRCPRCGYQLGSALISLCPECGAGADPLGTVFGRAHALGSWVQRRARVMAAILVGALLVQLGVTLQRRTLPARRFFDAFPLQEDLGPGSMIPNPPTVGWYDSSCLVSWVPDPGESARAIVILYVADAHCPLPAMRLVVAAPPPPNPSPSAGPPLDFGSPPIACELSRDMAESFIRQGIPAELLRALSDEATSANWAPSATPNGVFFATPQTHWVDAARFFPGSPRTP
jgi:hypothetical protein